CLTIFLSACTSNNELDLAADQANLEEGKAGTNVETNAIVLEGKVGAITEHGDLVFQRVSNDLTPITNTNNDEKDKGFAISNFGGNTSLDQSFLLDDESKFYHQ